MAADPARATRSHSGPLEEHRSRTAPLRWFAAMPIALLKDPSIAAESKVLAGLLIAYDGPKGCFPKIASLMKDLGSSKHTVIRCLEELERYGFLTRERRGRNNVYHLTPAYVQPARPDDITLTGELAVENGRPTKPVKRNTLHNRRPDPTLPLTAQQVAPEQPIPIGRGKSRAGKVASVQPILADDDAELVALEQPGFVAPVPPIASDRLHPSHLDITENQSRIYIQQQQDAAAGEKPDRAAIEYALIEAGVGPLDAVTWAMDLEGLDIDDVREALTIMRSKPSYRRREIARPGAYMRTLIGTAVHQERHLREHEARKTRSASTEVLTTTAAAIEPIATLSKSPAQREVRMRVEREEPATPDVTTLVDALDAENAQRVRDRAAQLCKTGPTSPAWPAALAIALSDVQRIDASAQGRSG